MRAIHAALVLFLLAPLGFPRQAEAPEAQRSGDEPSKVERWIELAREGAPQVRPQAAQRLVDAGSEGAIALKRAAGANNTDLAALGADLVEVLARFEDPELRLLAWRAVDDPDFPWRPAATRSLAQAPADAELPRFVELLSDPIPAVRVAALGAFPDTAAGMVANLFYACLSDEDGRVRRAAAYELARRDLAWAKLWLVEELERSDRWFEVDTGRFARFEA
ncbi:MAG: HEAT repeat domain-containing protein, partial [Planctomycetota bacterium]